MKWKKRKAEERSKGAMEEKAILMPRNFKK
jgi:hypothetical protein